MAAVRSHDRLRVVVAGGGVAGLEAVLALAERAREMLDVTLVANQDEFVFHARGVGAPLGLGHAYRLSLRDVARHTGITFRRAWVTGVDSQSRQLLLAGDERMSFDALLLALGARSRPAHPAFTTWRDNDPEALAALVRDVEDGYYSRSLAFVAARGVRPDGDRGGGARTGPGRRSRRDGRGRGLAARTHRMTLRLRPRQGTLEVDRVVELPRLEGRRLDGVPADDDGFIQVDHRSAVRALEGVWAAGDGAASVIKQGGAAAQQAHVAAIAIAALGGADVEPFRPALLTHGASYHPAAEDGDAGFGASSWPLGDAVGDRLATYLANHGAGPWLRSRSHSSGGHSRELQNRGRRRARQ